VAEVEAGSSRVKLRSVTAIAPGGGARRGPPPVIIPVPAEPAKSQLGILHQVMKRHRARFASRARVGRFPLSAVSQLRRYLIPSSSR
jgi:hypothetical protein